MPRFGMEVSWSELPGEILVSQILGRLPLPSLLRSRAVCRQWRKAVESSRERMLLVVGFLDESGSGSDSDSYVQIAWCVDNRSFDRWYKLQPPPWLRRLGGGSVSLPQASGGGGLLLSVSCSCPRHEWNGRNPHLGNPVAGSWTSLPQFPVGIRLEHLRGMWVDAEARCFKLVAVESDEWKWGPVFMNESTQTWVFDSALGTWNVTTCALRAPETDAFRYSDFHPGVFVGSVLYCLTPRCKLLAYDLERAGWSWLAVARPRRFVVDACKGPVNVRGRLLCLAVGVDGGNRCMQMWELDFARMAWTVVAAMPAPMVTHFWRPGLRTQARAVFAFGLSFCHDIMVVAVEDEVYFSQTLGDKMAALDLRETPPAWRWLPDWPSHLLGNQTLHCLDPWLQFGSWKQH